MRLLLDECVPRPLKRDLVGHDVSHVTDMGWSSKRNGDLLRLMVTSGFEALLIDQNLEFQQNLRGAKIAVLVVFAPTNRIRDLRPLVPRILQELGRLSPGAVIRVA